MEEALSDLQRAYEMLLAPIKKDKTELKYLIQGFPLLAHKTSRLELTAIAPPEKMMIEAEQHVAHVLETLKKKQKPRNWDLNRISTALWIKEREAARGQSGGRPVGRGRACPTRSPYSFPPRVSQVSAVLRDSPGNVEYAPCHPRHKRQLSAK